MSVACDMHVHYNNALTQMSRQVHGVVTEVKQTHRKCMSFAYNQPIISMCSLGDVFIMRSVEVLVLAIS